MKSTQEDGAQQSKLFTERRGSRMVRGVKVPTPLSLNSPRSPGRTSEEGSTSTPPTRQYYGIPSDMPLSATGGSPMVLQQQQHGGGGGRRRHSTSRPSQPASAASPSYSHAPYSAVPTSATESTFVNTPLSATFPPSATSSNFSSLSSPLGGTFSRISPTLSLFSQSVTGLLKGRSQPIQLPSSQAEHDGPHHGHQKSELYGKVEDKLFLTRRARRQAVLRDLAHVPASARAAGEGAVAAFRNRRNRRNVLKLLPLFAFFGMLMMLLGTLYPDVGEEGRIIYKESLKRVKEIEERLPFHDELEDIIKAGRVLSPEERKVAEMKEWRKNTLYRNPEKRAKVDVRQHRKGFNHEATVIFMHGMGEAPWETPLQYQISDYFPRIRWVMPASPFRPVTYLNGSTSTAWFDLEFLGNKTHTTPPDEESMYASARQINLVIREEQQVLVNLYRERFSGGAHNATKRKSKGRGRARKQRLTIDGEVVLTDIPEELPPMTPEERAWVNSRIVIGGFSQGSVMALLTGLTLEDKLAGIVVLSGFLPLPTKIKSMFEDIPGRKNMSIFWGHGQEDPYLLHSDALVSIDMMKADEPTEDGKGGLGIHDIEFHSYPEVQHTWFPGEMWDISQWIKKLLPEDAIVEAPWPPENPAPTVEDVMAALAVRDKAREAAKAAEEAADKLISGA